MKVTIPVTIAGVMIEMLRIDRLRPMAKASMLVATDNNSDILMVYEPIMLSDFFLIT